MKAVVLAAGKGTRMREITDSIPKPMVKVGGHPILWHVLSAIAGAGVKEAAIVVGHKAEAIQSYFGDGGSVGLKLSYFVQAVQDGTGRAAEPAREFLMDGPFLFSYGDILTDPSAYAAMAESFQKTPTDLLLAVRWVDDPYRFGVVTVRDGIIESIIEKPPRGSAVSHWVNAGIFVARPILFDYTGRLALSPRGEYELPDAFRMMIDDGRVVRAFELDAHWRDVGTPDDIASADREAEGRRRRTPDR